MSVKRSIFRIITIISLFLLICCPVCEIMNAIGPVDTNCSNGSIALGYKWNDEYTLHDVPVHIYKIASINSSGNISLTDGFENTNLTGTFPDSIYNNDDIYNQQQSNALSFYRYAQNNNYEPYYSDHTDASGEIFFGSLQVGVYLVASDSISYDENHRYDFSPFFVCLPYHDTPDMWKYHLTAYPKCFRTDLNGVEVTNRIIKFWTNPSSVSHPQEIRVQIFRNNDFFDEIEMSAAQNWIYEWTSTDDSSVSWSVKEINIPQNYIVIYDVLTAGIPASQLGTNPQSVFLINNKCEKNNTGESPEVGDNEEEDDNGNDSNSSNSENDKTGDDAINDIIHWIQTGDTSSIAWLTTLLSGLGVIILLLGIRRKVNSDKSGADISDKK